MLKNKLQRMKQHMGMENVKIEREPKKVPTLEEKKAVPFEQEWKSFDTTPQWFDGNYTLVREKQYPLSHQHGKYQFQETSEAVRRWQDHVQSHPLSAKDRHVEELLFFDTETTGLSSGAGNTIFLLGHCQIESDHVSVKQFFLPGPESEVALYHSFLTDVGVLRNLVTYNGKAFDWPQVKTRHTFVRDQVPKLPKFGHFDLLHAARRMWKDTLPSCKLSVVEKEILQFEREEDIPSYMAPMLYFDFLQDPDPEYVKGIFQHHEWDVLSLLTLYTHLSSVILQWDPSSLTQKEKYEVARWYEAIGESEIAMAQYETLKQMGTTTGEASLFAYANGLKKQKRWSEALTSYVSLVGTEQYSYYAAIECAKLYEHQVKDYEKAAYYCKQAIVDEGFVRKQPKEKQLKMQKEGKLRLDRIQKKMAK
ncbi:ribonuclease H-like domain-containing protein [Alkalihalobacillus sp. MEB130]|uniref:ribonuclease H-like domain-containing protein n=1 Tax=Alkalihalobacillus sp. MEB130 TaxID=2976704 RepID=UPI0028DDC9A0|nr:ribonuclease H-like domain-containing protein [Alkalihalobacillus sp. MEB130]MDT8859905.1 ribonuclease H-like domain-containing protein [Alkalihalobacillus sp. MEB130]